MVEYVRTFQNRAGAIVGSHQPNRPALVLYFGDIAMRGRAALHEKLISQIPENYHAAIVEGAFCSKAEAGSVPCMDVSFVAAPMDFGNYAQNWCSPDNLSAARDFLKELLQKTTEKPIAVTMSALDVYLVVGNDGGACELWPAILSILSDPALTVVAVKWHLVWMFREMVAYQQPRDLSMYRLIKVMENKKLTEAEVSVIPEVQAIPSAMEAWKQDLSLVVVSDRNQTGVCSNDVWTASCEAVAGYILAHMFNKNALPECSTCAMYDAIYPDVYWSTGFQLSAMIKLEEALNSRKSARMGNFLPILAEAWGVSSLDLASGKPEAVFPLVSNILPESEDLFLLPVNPNIDIDALKACKKLSDSVKLLYGDRFDSFFLDALENTALSERISQLVQQLREAVNHFACTNGVYAAAALLDEQLSEDNLPSLFQEQNFTAHLENEFIHKVRFLSNPIRQRQQEVVDQSQQKFTELQFKAIALLFERMKSAMKKWHTYYAAQAHSLQNAFLAAAKQFREVFYGAHSTYHIEMQKYAENKQLFTTEISEVDFEKLNNIFSLKASVHGLINALTDLNLRTNSFITLTMQEAFNKLGYPNGASDLKDTLAKFCEPALFSSVKYTEKDVYILPDGGDWSNGGRVYGLIRMYSSEPDASKSLLESISYLANLNSANVLQLEKGNPLPVGVQNTFAVSEIKATDEENEDNCENLLQNKQPLGKVQYKKPDSLLTFEWPRHGVGLINMTVNSFINFGQTRYEQTAPVSSQDYLVRGGTILPNVRLSGRCDVTLTWYEYGQLCHSDGYLVVEPVHISRVVTAHDKYYLIQITASEPVPNLESYLLLRMRKNNGYSIAYRLPALIDGQFTIDRKYCHSLPEVVLSDPKWNEYFSF